MRDFVKYKSDIDSDILNQLLRYDPDTGKLYWKERGEKWFSECPRKDVIVRTWNTRFSGKEAFTTKRNGYHKGLIFKYSFVAHRVIACMELGFWPEQVDHINGIRDDNRWENLRAASQKINSKNLCLRETNTSGTIGVNWRKCCHKWQARISSEGKEIYLGSFLTIEEAIEVRRKAEELYGYHENHGRKHRSY